MLKNRALISSLFRFVSKFFANFSHFSFWIDSWISRKPNCQFSWFFRSFKTKPTMARPDFKARFSSPDPGSVFPDFSSDEKVSCLRLLLFSVSTRCDFAEFFSTATITKNLTQQIGIRSNPTHLTIKCVKNVQLLHSWISLINSSKRTFENMSRFGELQLFLVCICRISIATFHAGITKPLNDWSHMLGCFDQKTAFYNNFCKNIANSFTSRS